MYTIQCKVKFEEIYQGEDYLMFFLPEGEPYRSMSKAEVEKLLKVFKNSPDIFIDPEIREWDGDPVLIELEKEKRYSVPLTCDFNYFYGELPEEDKNRLNELPGMIGGFSHKYVSDNI